MAVSTTVNTNEVRGGLGINKLPFFFFSHQDLKILLSLTVHTEVKYNEHARSQGDWGECRASIRGEKERKLEKLGAFYALIYRKQGRRKVEVH